MRAGMQTVVPFCVSIPSLVDNLSTEYIDEWNVNADAGSGSTDRTWK